MSEQVKGQRILLGEGRSVALGKSKAFTGVFMEFERPGMIGEPDLVKTRLRLSDEAMRALISLYFANHSAISWTTSPLESQTTRTFSTLFAVWAEELSKTRDEDVDQANE